MAAACGKAVVVSFKNNAGTPAYLAVAGLRTRSIAINAESVDVTNADSTGSWRELLDGCGVKSAVISGNGVFADDTGAEEVREALMAGSIRDAKIEIPGYGTFEGDFKVSQMELGADYNREVTVSMTLESAGEVTFTAA